MGLAATLVLAACGGSSSDDSTDTDQVAADTETETDGEQETSPPTTVVEVPDVTELPDDKATAQDPVPVEGTTPEPTPDLAAWTTFTTADGLASNDVVAVDVHSDGTTWAMTNTGGTSTVDNGISLSRFDDGTWTTFDVPERFSTGPLTLGHADLTDGLAAGPNGTAWYLGGGLWEFDGDAWTTVHDCDQMACPEVPGLALDVGGDGVLWSADYTGLLRRDGDGWTTIGVPSNTDMMVPWTGFDSPPFGYGVDGDGVVWVLTVDGVASYDGEWHDHPVPDGTLYGNQGYYGLAWWTLGSDGTSTTLSLDVSGFKETGSPILTAVSRFDGDEWTITDGFFELDSDPASITSGPDLKIAAIQDEHHFVSASMLSDGQRYEPLGGLIWTDYQAGTTTMLTVEDGLPSDNIRALVDSPDGVVWIVTDAGIARFVPGSTSMPAVSGVGDGQTVAVTVSGVSGHAGDDLAVVVYEGGELTDLERDAVGGFWSVISGDDFTTTEVVRGPVDLGVGRFPFVSDQALTVEPGVYTLVVWVDDGLGPVSRWVPVNTDGMGLFGCQTVFEVGADAQTEVVVSAGLQPDGWNTNCTAP